MQSLLGKNLTNFALLSNNETKIKFYLKCNIYLKRKNFIGILLKFNL